MAFPGLLRRSLGGLQDIEKLKRAYQSRFADARALTQYVVAHYDRLAGQTLLWNKTWYDSTLPHWFLDRTFASLCTLATSTCYLFDNGRFYAFEGVYCCQGTCQHVWNYAQGVARISPPSSATCASAPTSGLRGIPMAQRIIGASAPAMSRTTGSAA